MQWSCIPHPLLHQIYDNVCSLFLNILNIMHLLAASDSDIYSISSSAGRFPGKDDRQAHSNRSAAVSHQSTEVLKPCCQWMHFTKPTFFMWCKHEEEWEGREHPFIQGGEVKKNETRIPRAGYKPESRQVYVEWRKMRYKYWKDSCYEVIGLDIQPHHGAIMGKFRFTEYSHTDIKRPNIVGNNSSHCKTMLMWICLYISVTSAHSAWLNTHISGL